MNLLIRKTLALIAFLAIFHAAPLWALAYPQQCSTSNISNCRAGTGVAVSGGALNVTATSSGGSGTVTTLSVTTTNGISGTVANPTTTPAISLALGAITPTSVNGLTITGSTGTVTIANLKTLTASNTLTFTGTDGSSVNFGTGGTVAYTSNNLSVFAATSSAQLAGVLSDETGTGLSVFSASPTFTGTVLGAAVTWSGTNAAASFNATTAASAYKISGSNVLIEPSGDATSFAVGVGALANQSLTSLNNTAVGLNALNAVTTATDSVAVGANALSKETIIGSEVAIGSGALQNSLQSITTAGNLAVGYQALKTLTTGVSNTAIGYKALTGDIVGTSNVAIGYNTLPLLTASNTVAIGAGAGAADVLGNDSVFIGTNAGSTINTSNAFDVIIGSATSTVSANTAKAFCLGQGTKCGTDSVSIGNNANSFIASDVAQSVAIGSSALAGGNPNGTGLHNVAVGYQAGLAINSSSANDNTLVGYTVNTTLANSTSSVGVGSTVKVGTADVGVGYQALKSTATNGNNSTGVGFQALSAVTTGTTNTALGTGAGKLITVGAANTVLGPNVGSTTLTIGTNNILIGTNNAIDATTSSESNAIHIGGTGGDWAKVTGTNTLATEATTLRGSLAVPDVTTGTNADFACFSTGGVFTLQTSACTISQRHLKENFTQLTEDVAIRDLMMLTPTKFNFKATNPPNPDPNAGSMQYGFIAEEVAAVDPNLSIYENDMKTPKSYRQEAMISMLVKVVQKHEIELQDLKSHSNGHRCLGIFWCSDEN